MLNYEYDAEAERRVLKQEGREEGMKGMDFLVELLREGLSIDEALEKAKKAVSGDN